jgi:hypothetical protein
MGALTIDDVCRSVILATLKSSKQPRPSHSIRPDPRRPG